jgi:GxxExxY protein
MTENQVSKEIVDVALRVHRGLGPGLLESVYEAVMASQLEKRGLNVATQRIIPVVFEGIKIELGFRADLVGEGKVIVEIKSVVEVSDVHRKQLLTYLRLANLRLGLLINFNVALIKNGIVRIANGIE